MQDHVGAAAGDGVPEPDERAHGDADPRGRAETRRRSDSPAPARAGESERKPRESIEAHWIEIAGWGEVWMTSELFDVGPARAHLEGSVDSVSCPVYAFDERNRALHGYIQESLF